MVAVTEFMNLWSYITNCLQNAESSTIFEVDLGLIVVQSRALRRAGRAAAAGLFCNAAAADKNASARRRFRGRRAAVKVSDPISFSGENLHAAYNFWYLSASLLQFWLPGH